MFTFNASAAAFAGNGLLGSVGRNSSAFGTAWGLTSTNDYSFPNLLGKTPPTPRLLLAASNRFSAGLRG